MGNLAAAFADGLPEGLRGGALQNPGLEASLGEVVANGRGPWPDFEISDTQFARYLAQRLQEVPQTPQIWASLHAADLFLACGCGLGNKAALATFERNYGNALKERATRMARNGVSPDDVTQQVLQKLFVGTSRAGPRILEYTGRGPLGGWLNVIVARVAIDVGRSAGSAARTLQQGMADLERDPELEFLKQHYREAFEKALQNAIGGLSARQRNMLAYSLIDRLDTNEIGQIYGVHRTSAGRWLTDAREALLTETRQSLMTKLSVQRSDVDSIMRLIGSRLDVTFRHLLRPKEPTGQGK